MSRMTSLGVNDVSSFASFRRCASDRYSDLPNHSRWLASKWKLSNFRFLNRDCLTRFSACAIASESRRARSSNLSI